MESADEAHFRIVHNESISLRIYCCAFDLRAVGGRKALTNAQTSGIIDKLASRWPY